MDNPVITKEQMDELCLSSYHLLQTMSNIYGPDPSYEMFLKLEEVLGTEVKSNLFLKMLESSYGIDTRVLNFSLPNTPVMNVIDLIKAARTYGVDIRGNNLGLKEAKDIIDAARTGRGTINFINLQNRASFINILKSNNGRIL
jgi:hypothetical protein